MQFIITTIFAFLLLFGCSNTSVSGGSTTVENPFVICVVIDSENNPLDSVSVSLYPEEYDPLIGDLSNVRTAVTDSTGIAIINNITVENYSLIAMRDSVASFHSYLDLKQSIDDTIVITVRPTTSLRIHADSGAKSVYFPGTPYLASFDTLTSVYSFVSLPEGSYPSLSIVVENDTSELSSILIQSDLEMDLYISGETVEYSPVLSALSQKSGMNVISTSTMSDMVWFGTSDSGMWSVTDDSIGLRYFGGPTSFFNNQITGIESNPDLITTEEPIKLLLSSPEGTMHLEDSTGRYLERNEYPGVGDTFAKAMHLDRSGKAWTAYDTVICFTDESNEWSGRLTRSNTIAFEGDYDDTLFLGHADGSVTGINSTDTFMLDILKSSIPGVTLNDLALNSGGELICATSQGLYIISRDNALVKSYATSLNIETVVIDDNNSIYGLYGEKSILVITSNSLYNYADLFGNDVVIHDITVRGVNSLYVAAGLKGALHCDFVP